VLRDKNHPRVENTRYLKAGRGLERFGKKKRGGSKKELPQARLVIGPEALRECAVEKREGQGASSKTLNFLIGDLERSGSPFSGKHSKDVDPGD